MLQISTGYESVVIDYTPSNYKTMASAAKGLYKALVKFEKSIGIKEVSVIIQTPKESEEYGTGKNWRVIWEGGIYDWAIAAEIYNLKAGWYTEPYYSYDLCFTR